MPLTWQSAASNLCRLRSGTQSLRQTSQGAFLGIRAAARFDAKSRRRIHRQHFFDRRVARDSRTCGLRRQQVGNPESHANRGLSNSRATTFASIPCIRESPDTPLAYDPKTGEELVRVDHFAIPRMASVDEIIRYVLFVASNEAAFSTGSEFVADGGFALRPIV